MTVCVVYPPHQSPVSDYILQSFEVFGFFFFFSDTCSMINKNNSPHQLEETFLPPGSVETQFPWYHWKFSAQGGQQMDSKIYEGQNSCKAQGKRSSSMAHEWIKMLLLEHLGSTGTWGEGGAEASSLRRTQLVGLGPELCSHPFNPPDYLVHFLNI